MREVRHELGLGKESREAAWGLLRGVAVSGHEGWKGEKGDKQRGGAVQID